MCDTSCTSARHKTNNKKLVGYHGTMCDTHLVQVPSLAAACYVVGCQTDQQISWMPCVTHLVEVPGMAMMIQFDS